jgi:protein-L-isoaspartate(D-aspartate) O-methyltransferase
MLRLTKNADGTTSEEEFENFSFVPMLKGKND